MLRHLLAVSVLGFGGCSLLPEIAHQQALHNPFPQLSRVAVAPFFNMSEEPTLNTQEVALAYFAELQAVPGFEVVPLASVEEAVQRHSLRLSSPAEVRRLAEILGVDAVVIGAVTDYSPYYPPRLAMQVRWYSANPYFHPIPPGYGLPWGTPEEKHIPAPLVFEAEMALAKAQLATQTPESAEEAPPAEGDSLAPLGQAELSDGSLAGTTPEVRPRLVAEGFGLPPDWPDPHGFTPPPPREHPPACQTSDEPVLQHTALYVGNDPEVTEALASYYLFRDDARLGGWQSYLERSDDFIRFCCHRHIAEMLSARGGAGETRVVCRWPVVR